MYPHNSPRLITENIRLREENSLLTENRELREEIVRLLYERDQYRDENETLKHLAFFDSETGDVISREDFQQRY